RAGPFEFRGPDRAAQQDPPGNYPPGSGASPRVRTDEHSEHGGASEDRPGDRAAHRPGSWVQQLSAIQGLLARAVDRQRNIAGGYAGLVTERIEPGLAWPQGAGARSA